MTVSILIPVFNHETFLPDLFQSLLSNQASFQEILLLDDYSADGSYEVCRQSLSKIKKTCAFVHLEKNSRNLGVVKTFDKLIHAARGDILVPIASDDFFLENGLQARIEPLIANPRMKLAFCDGQGVDSQGKVIVSSLAAAGGFSPVDFTKRQIAKTFATKWNPPLNLQCWRRDLFKIHGGQYELDLSFFCEDFPTALWAGAHGEVGFSWTPCVGYRCRSWPQISTGNPQVLWGDMARIYHKYSRFYSGNDQEILRRAGDRFDFLSLGDPEKAEQKRLETLELAKG